MVILNIAFCQNLSNNFTYITNTENYSDKLNNYQFLILFLNIIDYLLNKNFLYRIYTFIFHHIINKNLLFFLYIFFHRL